MPHRDMDFGAKQLAAVNQQNVLLSLTRLSGVPFPVAHCIVS